MFRESEGPTALRAEFVCALSLSLNAVEVDGEGPFCAVVAGAWNGKSGTVTLLLRHMEEPKLRRFLFEGPLKNEAAVHSAVDEGISFCKSMGFSLDHPAFTDIGERRQKQRMAIWKSIRKLKSGLRHLSSAGPKRAKPAVPGKTVLGRLALVRQQNGGRRVEPLARLLSYF